MNNRTLNYTMAIVTTLAISATATSVAAPATVAQFQLANGGQQRRLHTDCTICDPTTPTAPPCRKFNSYNQPSVNEKKLVVFRARSKGGQAANLFMASTRVT